MERLLTLKLSATLEDMKFWLRIMYDHSRLIRGGLDLSESQYIHTADQFASVFEYLLNYVDNVNPNIGEGADYLIYQSVYYTTLLRNFKEQLYFLVNDCKVISKLPADVFQHVKEEANYFLTILCRFAGCSIPSKKETGIEDNNEPNAVVARKLIPYSKQNILEVAHDISLFWLDRHKEHGEVLLLIAYRPHIQEEFWDATHNFEQRIQALKDQFKQMPLTPNNILQFNNQVLPVMTGWHDFLEALYKKVFSCDVPSKGINADGSLLDHMAREINYYLDAIKQINASL